MSASGEVSIKVDKILKNVNQQVISRATRAVNAIRNAELEVLSGQRIGKGKVYRKPHTKRATWQPSAPGEPPAVRTGNLRTRWSGRIESGTSSEGVQVKAVLQSRSPYSGYLEDGTDKMEPRPFVDRITEQAMPEIKNIYSEPYT